MADSQYPVYPAAVGLALASLFVIVLMIPPMWWHSRNHNLGATLLVGWLVLLNFFTFINALLWPTDDITNWYNGSILCDIQVKLQIAARVGVPAANACVLRALAHVMDTRRATIGHSAGDRRRKSFIELLWAVGFPLLMFLAHYIVQWNRYYLFGISGCVSSVSDSWLSVILINLPGPIWTMINAYYAVLILIRLHKYRVSFASLLESRGTTKSRFLRLLCLCMFWLIISVPLQFYVLYVNVNITHSPYSWSDVHNMERWKTIIKIPSRGEVVYDRYIWLGSGIMVFVFFGMGKDAMEMYKAGLCAAGLGRIFPRLQPGFRTSPSPSSSSPDSGSSRFSSIGSKARMLFKRKTECDHSCNSDSMQSQLTYSTDSTGNPKRVNYIEAVQEMPLSPAVSIHSPFSLSAMAGKPSTSNDETNKGRVNRVKTTFSLLSRSNKTPGVSQQVGEDALTLTDMLNTVSSTVTSGDERAMRYHDSEVLVRREVRQGSEHAKESAESVMSHAEQMV